MTLIVASSHTQRFDLLTVILLQYHSSVTPELQLILIDWYFYAAKLMLKH